MPEFYDLQFFAVRRMATNRKRPGGWDITNEGGVPIAELEAQPRPMLARMLQGAGMKASYPVSLEIRSLKGGMLMGVSSKFGLGLFQATLLGSSGQPVGILKQTVMKAVEKGAHVYLVTDTAGTPAGSFTGDWRSNQLQMYDEKGSVIGKIARDVKLVSRVAFTHQEFFTVQLYMPLKDEKHRRLLMGSAAAIDRLFGK